MSTTISKKTTIAQAKQIVTRDDGERTDRRLCMTWHGFGLSSHCVSFDLAASKS
jgi:hypothetical protein